MARKPKLDIDAQIDHMQKQGITFKFYSKQEARKFLGHNNYFFKVKSYAKNYDKYNGVYKNLDFAYLVEFSTLDMHLRRFILNLSLDTEHLLKVFLNTHFCDNPNEDGYHITDKFLSENRELQGQINLKAKNVSFVKNLVLRYQNDFALWSLIEILSFGDFLSFYKFYFDMYQNEGKQHRQLHSLAYCVRILRNAAAHNNCILNTIKSPYNRRFTPNKYIQTYLSKIGNIPDPTRKKINSNPTLHDFVALIILFDKLCISTKMRRTKRKEFLELLRRFMKNKHYFEKNNFLVSRFVVFGKIGISVFFKRNINKKIR